MLWVDLAREATSQAQTPAGNPKGTHDPLSNTAAVGSCSHFMTPKTLFLRELTWSSSPEWDGGLGEEPHFQTKDLRAQD